MSKVESQDLLPESQTCYIQLAIHLIITFITLNRQIALEVKDVLVGLKPDALI